MTVSLPTLFLNSWKRPVYRYLIINQGNFFRAAAMTLRTVLLSLQSLLSSAEPDDPQDAVVAKQVCNIINSRGFK